jgi:DNA repair ATPase RecN
MGMNERDREATIKALRTLSARLETLRRMDKTMRKLPDQQQHYSYVLEDAYANLVRIETAVNKLEQELEYHHERPGKMAEPEEEEV